jgi:hydrogenase/urease accessory protein HupE
MMHRRLVFVVLLLAARATPLAAHPLDVYVQAAEIDVDPHGVTLDLRLTPGVNVARSIVAGIDTDGDGILSAGEQVAYAERVRRDVSLILDGRPLALRLTSSSFAPIDRMLQGLGDIVLVFQTDVPSGDGTHVITFENHHERATAAYLVNGLQPADATVRILMQDRTYDQSAYHLNFAVGDASGTWHAEAAASARAWLNRFGNLPVITTFAAHGVRHILTGYDHLLFLAALVLAAVKLWDLVKVVTAFTVAHSITLTLAALKLIHVSDRLVEPIIAASIVFVAVQNVFWPERSRGRARLAVAFVFGLFHGLGFAGGLLDVMHQMPPATVLLAIFGFSLGVETGNQIVLLPLFGAMRLAHRARESTDVRADLVGALQRFGSAAISVAGLYYLGAALAALPLGG